MRNRTIACLIAATIGPFVGCSVSTKPPNSADELVTAVCATSGLVAAGDVLAAKRVFTNGVHPGLHTLGDRVLPVDRGVAARMLEAKERLETAFESESPSVALIDDLRATMTEAFTVLDEPTTATCG